MTGAEIQRLLEQTLHAMARSLGVGVDFMEPVVLMGKLRVHKTPEGNDLYCWQRIPLLLVRREKGRSGTAWTFMTPDGEPLGNFLQES